MLHQAQQVLQLPITYKFIYVLLYYIAMQTLHKLEMVKNVQNFVSTSEYAELMQWPFLISPEPSIKYMEQSSKHLTWKCNITHLL